MKKERKERLYIIFKKTIPILVVLILYYIFVVITDLGIPCIFKKITGLRCPGCGVSRMCMALLRFDFVQAAKYNIFVLSLIPFILPLAIYKMVVFIKSGITKNTLFEKIFYPIVFVLCIAFAIIRNLGIIDFITL